MVRQSNVVRSRLWILLLAIFNPAVSSADRTVLFVDDHDVLYRPGTRRTLHQPARHPGPLISETKPWELAIGYCSVYRDPKTRKYQMWYQSYAGKRAQDPTRRVVLCYATSDDGVHWEKPNLGQFDFNGDKNTNIVLVGNGGRSVNYGASVIVDPRDTNPARRYKIAYWDFVDVTGKQIPGLCVAFSPDGIHWHKHPDAPLLRGAYGEPGQPPTVDNKPNEPRTRPAISDVIDVSIDARDNCYVIYSKTWIDGPDGQRFWKRAVVRTKSRDFIHWSAPELVIAPTVDDTGQLHGAPVFHRHGVDFALLQRLDFGGFDRGGSGNMPTELSFSRDGRSWQRPFRDRMFLPITGDASTFDAGCLWTNATPVTLREEIRFYYGAYPAWNSDLDNDQSGIGFATLPLDRFVSIEPQGDVGQITLRPIDLKDASTLTLNADARNGSIRVEVLSENGYRIQGFTKDEANRITSDSLQHPLKWKGGSVRDLPNGKYQLRIHLVQAKLFALSVR